MIGHDRSRREVLQSFRDGIIVEFSDYSKHPSMTVFRKKEKSK